MIKFNCPHCSATINARDDQASAKGRCKKCKKVVEVPEGAPVPPNPPSDDFNDAGEWGESYSEDGYDDGSQDPNDLYRQLPPTGKKKTAKERFWLKPLKSLILVCAFLLGIGFTLTGLAFTATYAWRQLPERTSSMEESSEIDLTGVSRAALELQSRVDMGRLIFQEYEDCVRNLDVEIQIVEKRVRNPERKGSDPEGVKRLVFYNTYLALHKAALSQILVQERLDMKTDRHLTMWEKAKSSLNKAERP